MHSFEFLPEIFRFKYFEVIYLLTRINANRIDNFLHIILLY